ncbi:extracellular solute-binding protein [Paenibacillus antri]|uniref:Extracellular solute-binding protein n=1 Tax=Paenibacillus antri TaxID=2582848 RepID=A0A5R9GM14_9BACL|nr:extracellular solute-binding protein [Paenibacillus antri]TLS54223.1 extracellular solute-binding protein [Paenibacillus antri]
MRTIRRRSLHGIGALLTCAALAGCVSLQPRINVSELPENRQSEETLELNMWLYGSTGLESLVEQYEEQHPNVNINLIHSTYEDVHNNLQTAFASGYGAPDVSLIEVSFMERFKKFPDYFENLGPLGAFDIAGEYLSWKWKQATNADGSFVYGLPTDIGPVAVVYNPKLYEAAGLPTERERLAEAMSTWEDFLEVGKRIKEKTGKPMIDQIRTLYRMVLFQADVQYFDPDTGELIIETNPAVKEAWNVAVRASELGLSAYETTWSPEWARGIAGGEFATILSPSWMLNDIKTNAPGAEGAWDITYLPEGSGNWGGSYLTIPKMSLHKEEAFAFIRWLTDPRQQLTLYKTLNNFPSTPGIYEDPAIRNKTDPFFKDAPVGRIFSDIAKEVRPMYEGSKQHVVTQIMEAALDAVEEQRSTPDEAWNEAMSLIQKQLRLEPWEKGVRMTK